MISEVDYKVIVGKFNTVENLEKFYQEVNAQLDKKKKKSGVTIEWWDYLGGPSINANGDIVQAFVKKVNDDPNPFD